MKIGYFVGKFPRHPSEDQILYGGGITVAYKLAIKIAERGHKISVFTTSPSSESFVDEYKNLTIYRYATNFKLLNRSVSFNMLLEPLEHDVDFIHVHTGDSPMDVLAPLLYTIRNNKTPMIVSSHADIGSYSRLPFKIAYFFYYNILINKLLSHADSIISPSKTYANESILKRYKEKVVVIPNGIDLNEFSLRSSKEESRRKLNFNVSEKIVLFVGGLEPRKAPDILIKAISKVVRIVPNSKLVIVGSGSMENMLKNLTRQLKISKLVRFAGFVKNNEKALYYRSADVFVLPSLYEIFGIVNLEAMACGVPIVASKIGGIPDVVKDGENGLLVSPGDSEALADAIIYLLENEDVREEMGDNGRKKVEGYSWDKIAEETEKVYDELLQ